MRPRRGGCGTRSKRRVLSPTRTPGEASAGAAASVDTHVGRECGVGPPCHRGPLPICLLKPGRLCFWNALDSGTLGHTQDRPLGHWGLPTEDTTQAGAPHAVQSAGAHPGAPPGPSLPSPGRLHTQLPAPQLSMENMTPWAPVRLPPPPYTGTNIHLQIFLKTPRTGTTEQVGAGVESPTGP